MSESRWHRALEMQPVMARTVGGPVDTLGADEVRLVVNAAACDWYVEDADGKSECERLWHTLSTRQSAPNVYRADGHRRYLRSIVEPMNPAIAGSCRFLCVLHYAEYKPCPPVPS